MIQRTYFYSGVICMKDPKSNRPFHGTITRLSWLPNPSEVLTEIRRQNGQYAHIERFNRI